MECGVSDYFRKKEEFRRRFRLIYLPIFLTVLVVVLYLLD